MADQLRNRIDTIAGMLVYEKFGVRHIKLSAGVTPDGLELLLQLLRETRTAFSFHDPRYPSPSDPGAYISYSREKNTNDECWAMSLGNHGWTGGIYQIRETTILRQLKSLYKYELLDNIQIDKVSLFTSKGIAKNDESEEINHLILRLH